MVLVADLSSVGQLRFTGKDRVRFLQGMLTNDVARLTPGAGCHAAMLNAKGKLVGDMLVYAAEGAHDLVLEGEHTQRIQAALDRYLIADDVTIEDLSAARGAVGVYGDDAARVIASVGAGDGWPDEARLAGLLPHHFIQIGELRIAAARDIGMNGYRVYGPRDVIHQYRDSLVHQGGARAIDEAEREVLRVEAGQPRYGVDMGDDRMANEARLDDAISHTKGCYVGQEVVVRLRDQGHLNWRLMGLRIDGEGAVAPGSRLSAPGRADAGVVTSSVVSPRYGAIALGYVHRSLFAPGTALTVADSAGERRATVVDLPFSAAPPPG